MNLIQYRFMVSVVTDHVDKAFAVRDEMEKHINQASKRGSAPQNTEVFVSEPFTLCHRAPEPGEEPHERPDQIR